MQPAKKWKTHPEHAKRLLLALKYTADKLGLLVDDVGYDAGRIDSVLGEALLDSNIAEAELAYDLYEVDGSFIGPTSVGLIDVLNQLAGYIIYPNLRAYLEVRYVEFTAESQRIAKFLEDKFSLVDADGLPAALVPVGR